MSLQVWLPLTKDLRQQGLSNVTITNNGATFNSAGKLGGCYSFDGVDDRISCSSYACTYPMSISAWFKPTDVTNTNTQYWLSYNTASGGTAGHAIGIGLYGAKLSIWYGGQVRSLSTAITNNVWYHITVTIDANKKVITYLNGVQIDTVTFTSNNPGSAWLTLGARSNSNTGGVGGALYFYKGYMNDARLYDHCLSPMEVKELAKGLVLHYLLKGNTIVSQYDNNLYVEPDGSVWTRVFHHDNPSNALFISSDTFSTGVYKDTNRWYDIETISNIASTWEFMVKQKTTSSASEVKYRWIQTKNPVNSVWADVQPSAVTRITTSGYTDGGYGGLWKQNSGTRMVIANSNSGNWYGAAGSWSAYNGGIPGYPNTTITTGYMDIYIRVDNLNSIIYDCSGYCNNAQSNGSVGLTYSTDSSKYKVATVFASGARIATSVSASTFMPKDAITVSIWFKSSAAANRFISCTEGGGFNFESNSGNIRFVSYIAGQGYAYANSSTTWSSVSDNNWHMITATNDRQTVKIYLDGTLIQETTCQYSGTALGYASSTPFTLGAEAQTIASPIAGTYVGSLVDCRIYATALSATDVLSLYQNTAYIDGSGNIYGKIRD